MTPGNLAAVLEDLHRATARIARLAGTVRTAEEGIPARARTILDAIEERNRIAAAALAAIAEDDQDINARLAIATPPPGTVARLAVHLVRRDREIETIARMIDRQTREYAALARDLERSL
jgi:ABC-type transporter Mla subunit MlaD